VRPITAIGSITYVDTSGATSTWSNTNYTFKDGSLTPSIWLNYGLVWPIVRGDQEGITVTLVAGYASLTDVRLTPVKLAIKLKLRELWQVFNDADPTQTMKAYDRQIGLAGRSDYA
jgi:hypothetical protein